MTTRLFKGFPEHVSYYKGNGDPVSVSETFVRVIDHFYTKYEKIWNLLSRNNIRRIIVTDFEQ